MSILHTGMCTREWTYELDTPAQQGGLEVLVLTQLMVLEDLERVHNREAAVQLPAWDVMIQILSQEPIVVSIYCS